MAWTSPMTAIAGSVFTAAQFNTNIRDNLNETGPAKVTAAGQILVSTAASSLAARTPGQAYVATSEATTSTSYAALTTPGPVVAATTGASALVALYCAGTNSGSTSSLMSYDVSGATTVAASDPFSLGGAFGTAGGRPGALFLHTGLNPGANTFTAKYRVGSGTGTFVDRRLVVIPL